MLSHLPGGVGWYHLEKVHLILSSSGRNEVLCPHILAPNRIAEYSSTSSRHYHDWHHEKTGYSISIFRLQPICWATKQFYHKLLRNNESLNTCDIEPYLGLSDTFIPCLDATEVWSTPVMNMPSPYSIPPLIINPRLSSGLRLNDTWVQKWFFQTFMLTSLVKNIRRSSS